jgi:hypothetical protein
MVLQDVLFALPVMRTLMARLRVVVRHRGDLGLGVLHHWLNLWSGKKGRTQRLILDALGQPLDDPRRLTKGSVCLCRLALGLIHPSQRRLDLPAFSRQPKVCGQVSCFAQIADDLLSLPLSRCQGRQRPQVGNAVARGRSHTFPQSLHLFSRLAL